MSMSAIHTRDETKNRKLPKVRARAFDDDKDPPVSIGDLLSPKQEAHLRQIVTVLEFEHSNNTIFCQNEDAHFAYAVATGLVRVSRHFENGHRQTLAFMFPGDLFGLPHQGHYLNFSQAVCPSKLYRISWQQWSSMMRGKPGMQGMLRILIAFDLWRAQRRMVVLSEQTPTQKVVTILLGFTQHAEFYDARRGCLELPLSRFDLGDYLDIAPETVVRTLAKLQKRKFIRRLSPRTIEIKNLEALRHLVRQDEPIA
jgi:CRP-like cAMP-binding protein